MVLRAKKE